ncbi:TRAP transporter permease [Bacillus sp. ISL-45]|uniref:TRAP transporter permease n=1 Tax=Bacillus sp. ISL-45 TaxID=2819128 RepID=UPI001BE7ECAA|nr:TRAP transporter permease [Bacillus sp. ISL-45]MBT2661649.1 TRAP transporter permease [Bacillus sp. ISL-45]
MQTRNLQGPWSMAFRYTAIAFSLFYLYAAGIGLVSTELHRGLYLLFNLALGFMIYPLVRKKGGGTKVPFYDLVLIGLTILSFGYWILEYKNYVTRAMMPNDFDFWFGIIAIILLFEITRRVLGNVLLIIGLVFFLQLYFGPYLPGNLAHSGFSIERIVEFNYSSMEGIFGVITQTFATYVLPFIILGAFFEKSGAGDFFIKLAVSLTKGWSGGPAKVAVIASGVFGSISGSSVANVVSTGAFTIPMMKRVGFKPHVAGAIEAAASTGGQFLPPVMGAGAFLLATLTETSYTQIALMNVIPALLYFYWVGSAVHFEAKRYNIMGLPENEIPDFWITLKSGWFFFAPLALIVIVLVLGFSPALAAFWAIISTIVLSWINKNTRMGVKEVLDALEIGGKNNLSVGASIGMLGIIMGGMVLAGLGAKFSSLVVSLSGGIVLISIALVAFVGALIGMGATQTATYLIVAMITVPGMIALGIDKVTAHIIAFWFSAISNVTPPVCVSAFAAASIAKADPMKTGFTGVKYSLLLFILPFTFVYFPEILLQGSIGEIIYAVISFAIAIPILAAGIQGFLIRDLTILQRAALLIAGIMMFIPTFWTDLIGIVVVLVVYFIQKNVSKPVSLDVN